MRGGDLRQKQNVFHAQRGTAYTENASKHTHQDRFCFLCVPCAAVRALVLRYKNLTSLSAFRAVVLKGISASSAAANHRKFAPVRRTAADRTVKV